MYLAIIGTLASGTCGVARYLETNCEGRVLILKSGGTLDNEDLSPTRLENANLFIDVIKGVSKRRVSSETSTTAVDPKTLDVMTMYDATESWERLKSPADQTSHWTTHEFPELMDLVTKEWTTFTIILGVRSLEQLTQLKIRPYVKVVFLDAPFDIRNLRLLKHSNEIEKSTTFPDEKRYKFLDDIYQWGIYDPDFSSLKESNGNSNGKSPSKSLMIAPKTPESIYPGVRILATKADINIVTSSYEEFMATVQTILLPLGKRKQARPPWTEYFMCSAQMAATRSNCMKREVGAAVVSPENRLISIGYNGTPRNVKNCDEGGCKRCNEGVARQGSSLSECLCLHAEENAIADAGYARTKGATIYTTTFPCLTCFKRIINAGIITVWYREEYGTSEQSQVIRELATQANVTIHRHINPNFQVLFNY